MNEHTKPVTPKTSSRREFIQKTTMAGVGLALLPSIELFSQNVTTPKSKKFLLINGHTDFEKSNANKTIIEELKKLAPNIEISHLGELYPDFKIDIKAEQEKLKQADIIVWQFPLFWYSLPSLLKKWVDDVFTHGFAFGTPQPALKGKKLILSFTTGSAETAYQVGGKQNHPITDFLHAHRQTATICHLEFGEFVVSYDMAYIPEVHPAERLVQVQEKAKKHAKKLLEVIHQ